MNSPSIFGSLFKNERKQTERQPDYTGPGQVSKEAFMQLADAVTSGQVVFNDRGEIQIRVAGWRKESRSGQPYISLQIQLDQPRTQQEPPAASPAAGHDGGLF